jgi:Divergent InlB B-repeat domain
MARWPLAALVTALLVSAAPADAATRQLSVVNASGGTVKSADGRIKCGTRCSAMFARGQIVQLSAKPARYFKFTGWSGGCFGTAPKCAVAVDRATTVRPRFERLTTRLDIVVSGPGTVVSDPPGIECGATSEACSADFDQGIAIALAPRPQGDASFKGFGGVCSGDTACSLVTGEENVVTAAFSRTPGMDPATLSVTADRGSVTSSPAGIACPPSCSADFPPGSAVTLSSVFGRWSGDCVGAGAECPLVMAESLGVQFTPEAAPTPSAYGLNVSISGRGSVVGSSINCAASKGTLADCEALFPRGQTVTLRAVPSHGARFMRWGQFCTGKSKRCSVKVTAAKIVLAQFSR